MSQGEALPEPMETIIMDGTTDRSQLAGNFSAFLETANGFMGLVLAPGATTLVEVTKSRLECTDGGNRTSYRASRPCSFTYWAFESDFYF